MRWNGACFLLLLLRCADLGISSRDSGSRIAPRLKQRVHHKGTSGWIGPFKPSEEELRFWRETFSGFPGVSESTPREKYPPDDAVEGNMDRSGGLLGRVRTAIGDARVTSLRTTQAVVRNSAGLGKLGIAWLTRRWRSKILYCLLGAYGIRLAARSWTKIRMNVLSTRDILLDAEDKAVADRGVILDVEGQALLLQLGALGSPDGTEPGSASSPDDTAEVEPFLVRTPGRTGGGQKSTSDEGGPGWRELRKGVERAMRLRCAPGRRARYTEELCAALRSLEEVRTKMFLSWNCATVVAHITSGTLGRCFANSPPWTDVRDEADMARLGQQRAAGVEQAVILLQGRLCDALLRSLRDGLIHVCVDLSELSSFWSDKMSSDRRMSVIRSFVLGTLVHGQVSGRRAAVERDQGHLSSSELLLERYLRRLGAIQTHLQARPRMKVAETSGLPGGVLTKGTAEALEEWIEDGMYLYEQYLEEVEASVLEHFDREALVGVAPELGSAYDGSPDEHDVNVTSVEKQPEQPGDSALLSTKEELPTAIFLREGVEGGADTLPSSVRGGHRSSPPSESGREGSVPPGLGTAYLLGRASSCMGGVVRSGHYSDDFDDSADDVDVRGPTIDAGRSDQEALPGRLRSLKSAPVQAVDSFFEVSPTGGAVTAAVNPTDELGRDERGLLEGKHDQRELSEGDDQAPVGGTTGRLKASSTRDHRQPAGKKGDAGLACEGEDGNASTQATGVGSAAIPPTKATDGTMTSFSSPGLSEGIMSLLLPPKVVSGGRVTSSVRKSPWNCVGPENNPVWTVESGSPKDVNGVMVVNVTMSDSDPSGTSVVWIGRAARLCAVPYKRVAAVVTTGAVAVLGMSVRAVKSSVLRSSIRRARDGEAVETPALKGAAVVPALIPTILMPSNGGALVEDASVSTNPPKIVGVYDSRAVSFEPSLNVSQVPSAGSSLSPGQGSPPENATRRQGRRSSAWSRVFSSLWLGMSSGDSKPPKSASITSATDVVNPSTQDLTSSVSAGGASAASAAMSVVDAPWALMESPAICAIPQELVFLPVERFGLGTELAEASISEFSLEPKAAPDLDFSSWRLTEPGEGVPRRSGRRSRDLAGLSTRSSRLGHHGSVGSGSTVIARAVRARAATEVGEAGATRPLPRKALRRVIVVAVTTPLAVQSGRWVLENWAELRQLGLEASAGLNSFFSEQLWRPCKAIVNKVFFRQRSNLLDPEALEDAETTVRNMLRDYLESKNVPERVRVKAVNASDISLVSRQLEIESRSTVRSTISGQLPRILLIQMAYVKQELLQALQAIDELFQANQVNLLLISAVPAALALAVAAQLAKALVQSATSRRLEPTVLVHRSMRASLRKVERLLSSSRGFAGTQTNALGVPGEDERGQRWQQGVDSREARGKSKPSRGGVGSRQAHGVSDSERRLRRPRQRHVRGDTSEEEHFAAPWGTLEVEQGRLDEEELGNLALCLHALQTMLRQNYYRFEARARRGLEEDLQDLLRGRATVLQQMAIVRRMQRSYPFLRPEGA